MTRARATLRALAEAPAAAMMALMFATFILQVFIRYSARLPWIADAAPWLEPTRFGWTLEFCLLLWLWLIFWGNAFIVRSRDHVTFDILYDSVGPRLRRAFAVITGAAIVVGLAASIEPTWAKFYILRLKKTATLSSLLGDGIRMRDIYAIYILFLVAVAARYAWVVIQAVRGAHEEAPE